MHIACQWALSHISCSPALRSQVYAWTEKPGGGWDKKLVHDFRPVPVWRVSWALTGNILAVSDGNGAVTLWKESLDGSWQQVQQ